MKYSDVKWALGSVDRDELKEFIEELGEDVVKYYLDDLDQMVSVINDLPCKDAYEIVKAACACGVQLGDVVEAYVGSYSSDEEFARDRVEEMGGFDIPSCVHIDWEGTARDLMMDYSDDNGYYFQSM